MASDKLSPALMESVSRLFMAGVKTPEQFAALTEAAIAQRYKQPTPNATGPHWLTRYDSGDGEPYGDVCDCDLGFDHDGDDNPNGQ